MNNKDTEDVGYKSVGGSVTGRDVDEKLLRVDTDKGVSIQS